MSRCNTRAAGDTIRSRDPYTVAVSSWQMFVGAKEMAMGRGTAGARHSLRHSWWLSAALGLALAAWAGVQPRAAAPATLFFSEYIEGSSNNKALEIFNGTGAPVS